MALEQQIGGPVQPPPCAVTDRRLAQASRETLAEHGPRDSGPARDRSDSERLGIASLDELHRPRHRRIVRSAWSGRIA
jgi:hypothetical protein